MSFHRLRRRPRAPALCGAVVGLTAALLLQSGCTTVTIPPAPAYTIIPPAEPPLAHTALVRHDRERVAGTNELLGRAGLTDDERVSLLAQRASARLTLGEYSAAIADLQEAVRLAPAQAGLRLTLARALWALDHVAEAREQIAAATSLAPAEVDPPATAGLVHSTAGEWDDAATLFTAAYLRQNPSAYVVLLTATSHLRVSDTARSRIDQPLEQVIRGGLWPAPIAEALLGRIAPESLDVLATHPHPLVHQRWKAETAYYLGELAATRGAHDEAMRRFRECLAYGAPFEPESVLARARLRAAGAWPPNEPITLLERTAPAREASGDDIPSELTPESRTDMEINRLARSGAIEQAILRLRTSTDIELTDQRLRLLASLLLQSGQAAEAIATWQSLLRERPDDWQALAAIGWTELQLAAQHGADPRAGLTSNPLLAAFNPGAFLARREGNRHLDAARDAFVRARTLQPDDPALTRVTAHVLELTRDPAGALALCQQLATDAPDDETTVAIARNLAALGRLDEAQPLIASLLAASPNHADAHAAAAEVARRRGDRAAARRHEEWAKFGALLPPGSRLDFTPAHADLVRQTITEFISFGPFVAIRVPKERPRLLEVWRTDASATATELLAAAWWNAAPDDDQAVSLAQELQRRGREAMLRAALATGGNPAAIGGAAHALAATGDTALADRLIELARQDLDRSHVGDFAGALAALQDIRGMMPLVAILDPGFEPLPRLSARQRDALAGYHAARARAALALASFDTEYVRNALAAGTRNPEIALHCHAALFALTGEDAHFDAIASALRYTEFVEMRRTFALLERTGDARAKTIADHWRQRTAAAD